MKIVPIVPHGFCDGVGRAVAAAFRLVCEADGDTVWFLHEPVHSDIVTGELKTLGCRFTESIDEVPKGATVVLSAHGVSPDVRTRADERGLKVVDLVCPRVTKAHQAVREAAARGDEVIVLGDRGHAEVKGLLGELPSCGQSAPSGPVSVICQTSMNLESARREVEVIAADRGVAVDSLAVCWPCRATEDRQSAVRRFCAEHSCAAASCAVLVLGSRASANAGRLRAVAEECGAAAYLASSTEEVRGMKAELVRHEVLGVTSGASTPESLFEEALALLGEAA